jgi:hypothetical protein
MLIFFVSWPEGLSYDRRIRSSVEHLATSISGIAYYPRLKGIAYMTLLIRLV